MSAMANSSAPDSTGSQFFIVLSDKAGKDLDKLGGPPYLYSSLGQVTKGFDVVKKLGSLYNRDQSAADTRTQKTSVPLYIFKVTKIATQVPDAGQIEALKSNAFTNWYNAEKTKATITRGRSDNPAKNAALFAMMANSAAWRIPVKESCWRHSASHPTDSNPGRVLLISTITEPSVTTGGFAWIFEASFWIQSRATFKLSSAPACPCKQSPTYRRRHCAAACSSRGRALSGG